MNCIMSFTKDIKLNTNYAEISSMSLEHEYNVNEKLILGNFFITGTYKPHELSVNTEEFSFTLPFDVSLSDNIMSNTVTLDIDNFTYELMEGSLLKVDIDYLVKGEEVIMKEEVFEEEPKDFSNLFEERIDPEIVEASKEEIENKIDEESVNAIMNFASDNEESFVTYNIHIMKQEDTLEVISKLYNKNEMDIMDYNKDVKFLVGDKILIPLDE